MRSFKVMYPETIIALLMLGMPAWVSAQEEADEVIEQAQDELDDVARSEVGRQEIESRLKDEFEVDDARIAGLRDQHFGYGEIKTALSLAQRMDGGINDENIQKIVDLRTGDEKKGWGEIAEQFDVKVGDLKKDLNEHGKSQLKDVSASDEGLRHSREGNSPKGPKHK